MTNIPDGAQRSEDGQWWWDDTQQQWQPVGESSSSAGSSDASVAAAPGDDDASSVTYAEAQAQGSGGYEMNISNDEIASILEAAGASEPGVA